MDGRSLSDQWMDREDDCFGARSILLSSALIILEIFTQKYTFCRTYNMNNQTLEKSVEMNSMLKMRLMVK